MKKLKSILLEYEDGSANLIKLTDLDMLVQSALSDSGLCSPPAEISSAKHYLILEWKDGWKEVVAINSDVASLIRYYVIRRIEDRGRLALDVGTEYPKLMIIKRVPKEMSRLLIVSENKASSYLFQSEVEAYEGIFEDGGKKEYKKYDRANPLFQNEFKEAPESVAEIKNIVAEVLKKRGLKPEEVLSLEQGRRIQEYQEIANTAGLKGAERQSDVYGLIEMVLKQL